MKKLAVLGASYLQLPLVKKAKELNIEVHCFAWDDDRAVCKTVADYFYGISVLDKELILEKCKEIGINGILTIATDICIPVIAYIAEHLHLVGNSITSGHMTTNKGLMRDCFWQHNILAPKYRIVKSANDFNLDDLTFPLIIKPVDRSGSLGVIKVENQTDLNTAIHNCLDISFVKSCIVEEYIFGKEVSVETISYKGNHHIITITDKTVTEEPYFVELAHHQPSTLPREVQQKIKQISLDILQAVKVENGASHIEFKIHPNGAIYVIEIGSRMGGDFIGSDLVCLSTGFDFTKAVIDIALNQFEGYFESKIKKYSGVYFLSKNTEQLLPYFEENKTIDGGIIVKKQIQNMDLKYITNSNDRSGYLIYQADKRINL